jgi:hypothetical protein
MPLRISYVSAPNARAYRPGEMGQPLPPERSPLDRFNPKAKYRTVPTGRSAQNSGLLFHMTVETSAFLPSLPWTELSLLWAQLSLLRVRLSLFRANCFPVIG